MDDSAPAECGLCGDYGNVRRKTRSERLGGDLNSAMALFAPPLVRCQVRCDINGAAEPIAKAANLQLMPLVGPIWLIAMSTS